MAIRYQLRECAPGDEEALALVGAASFLEAFAGTLHGSAILGHCRKQHSAERYREWLNSPEAFAAMAEVAGPDGEAAEATAAPVGYAVLCPPDLPVPLAPHDIELKRIYLLHRFQKLGIGTALMDWAVAKARSAGKRRMLLGVYGKNEPALAYYARCGFRQTGQRRFQVGDQVYDDAILARDL